MLLGDAGCLWAMPTSVRHRSRAAGQGRALVISLVAVQHLVMSSGRYLRRPYGKVDRARLKQRLLERCIAQGARHRLPRALSAGLFRRHHSGE